VDEVTFRVEGMHCLDCATKVQQALEQVPGVLRAHVHYLKKTAVVVGESVAAPAVEDAVSRAGYQVRWPADDVGGDGVPR
jgi:Cu+-exporting ATPase